ncbi:putative uncharacterized protein DDB_G0286901 [Uranotaenia lowii]|uniref:putative uncharacterized protein DDB_G0286901 n=1 Tax=Uranotaenia lowii TaxID=190385 RepID=UPI0024792529|nr:putative uncharacterized protein DDB_G0286901 [Uranotaenia lowii]
MPDFDIKTATALVHPYDGAAAGLESFIDSANLLNEIVSTAHKEIAGKFLRTRLIGKARLGLPDSAKSIETIVANVKERCQDRITPDSILSKMKNVRQNQSPQTLCDEVEGLTAQLKAVYLGSKIPDDVASTMANKAGVDALINVVTNNDTKLILKAGTFNNVKEAVVKVLENSTPGTSTNQVLSYSSRGRYKSNRGNRDSQRFNNRYHGNNGRQYNNQRNYASNRYNNNRRDHRNYGDNHNNNQRYYNEIRNNNNYRNRNGSNDRNRRRNVYYVENDQPSTVRPQPETDRHQPQGVILART